MFLIFTGPELRKGMGREKFPWHYLIYCIYFRAILIMGVDASSWTAEVPSSVSGLNGSCIIIPCSFNYPGPKIKLSKFTGIWLKNPHEFIYHPDKSKIIKDYSGRTALVGDLRQKNCSLKIAPLHHSDKGPFHFRVEIKDLDNYSYLQDTVSIAVSSSAECPSLSVRNEMKVGEVVSASCSVVHSCPSEPPLLTWSSSKSPSVQTQQLANGQWEVTSSLTFTSSINDNNRTLVCTAEYNGGVPKSSNKTLNVKYAPVDVKVKGASSVKEGASVELRCSYDSNPAAHSFHWHNSKGPMPSRRSTITLHKVTRLTEALYCIAINTEGRGKSISLKVKVEYQPEFKVGSTCTTHSSTITCLCIVDWEPIGTVEWSIPGRLLPSTRVESQGSITTVTLQRELSFSDTVHCYASNTQGNATLSIAVPTNYTELKMNILIAVGAFMLVLIIIPMTACILIKKCRQSHNQQTGSSIQDTDEVIAASSDPSPLRKEFKHISSEIQSNFYTNYHLYGNIEVEEDENTYSCIGEDDAIYTNL
ncbi:hypothetical protein UPYG_G00151830 [Umbra pygmaea]|uniref:Ig-like domain-containing protein n=1 Tax=Umbra pygmaea TaxID=75934 RepID=A0ABD0XJR7_UMBPY